MPIRKLFTILLFLATPHALAVPSLRPLPSDLQALYASYPALIQTLGHYADTQGFRGTHERLSTIVHELIHIDSAARQAYRIRGQSFDPYNQPAAWPSYRFAQFSELITNLLQPGTSSSSTKSIANTPVYNFYVISAPNNTLASLADELNAYGQSTSWLCSATISPEERFKSTQSMRDMLRITNAFLVALRTQEPTQHTTFYTRQKPARNLLALTALNAIDSLTLCGSSLPAQDRTELDALIAQSKREAR